MWLLNAFNKWRKTGVFVRVARQISLGCRVVAASGVGWSSCSIVMAIWNSKFLVCTAPFLSLCYNGLRREVNSVCVCTKL